MLVGRSDIREHESGLCLGGKKYVAFKKHAMSGARAGNLMFELFTENKVRGGSQLGQLGINRSISETHWQTWQKGRRDACFVEDLPGKQSSRRK